MEDTHKQTKERTADIIRFKAECDGGLIVNLDGDSFPSKDDAVGVYEATKKYEQWLQENPNVAVIATNFSFTEKKANTYPVFIVSVLYWRA